LTQNDVDEAKDGLRDGEEELGKGHCFEGVDKGFSQRLGLGWWVVVDGLMVPTIWVIKAVRY
jgi:hypothetical protein